jgi:hypothetical protein
MRLIRRLLFSLTSSARSRRDSYESEVLFAGWVELPAEFREIIARR